MIKMQLEYAQRILDGGSAFGSIYVSCYDGLLVIETQEEFSYDCFYSGTQLKSGELQVDDEGYVVFTRVEPVIDENTRFSSYY